MIGYTRPGRKWTSLRDCPMLPRKFMKRMRYKSAVKFLWQPDRATNILAGRGTAHPLVQFGHGNKGQFC